MAKKYQQIQSVEAGNAWLVAVERRITQMRLEQSLTSDKMAWYRIQEQLTELEAERREVRKQIAKLEVIEHEDKKLDKIKNTKKFGRVFK